MTHWGDQMRKTLETEDGDGDSMLKELSGWDFPDTELIPEGYDLTTVPKMSDSNFRLLVEEHNKVVRVINAILDGKILVIK
jgi:hypothetical protein